MKELNKDLLMEDFQNLSENHKELVDDIEKLKVEKLRMLNEVGTLEQVQIYQDWVLNLLDYLLPATQQQIVDAIVEQDKKDGTLGSFEIVDNQYIQNFKNRLKNKDWLNTKELNKRTKKC